MLNMQHRNMAMFSDMRSVSVLSWTGGAVEYKQVNIQEIRKCCV